MGHTLSPRPLLPSGFDFAIDMVYSNELIKKNDPAIEDAHLHGYCEIYLNLTGNVSFAIENHLYPVQSGDIIITRPNEVHRCVYHEDCIHEHYCLWLKSDLYKEKLLTCFYDRPTGVGNRIVLEPNDKKRIIGLFREMWEVYKTGEEPDAAFLTSFFEMLVLINSSQGPSFDTKLPADLQNVLDFIHNHYAENCSMGTLCDRFFVCPSTLNRRFRQYLNTTPFEYIENRRLSVAKKSLESGESVSRACSLAGFPDYSHFISLFKKRFGMTPLKYSKDFQTHTV